MKKIITVIGARPQFIKAAVVSRALKKAGKIKEVIVHTGQHFDYNMSEVFFKEMDIPTPHYNLNVNSLGHGAMTGRMLEELEKVLVNEKPNMVLVYGDTNSTLAGALAAVKLNIPVSHVEAGLRSFNNSMPEEINRILTDRISSQLFCPTEKAVSNLINEGFKNYKSQIFKHGDVMYDAVMYYGQISDIKSNIINKLNLSYNKYILCTIHRQESINNPSRLNSIFNALNKIGKTFKIVLPLHPGTRKHILDYGIKLDIDVIDPVGYFDMLALQKHCKIVVTDSGGMQKEAFFAGRYCVTLREETEWTELVENGFNFLAGYNEAEILERVSKYSSMLITNKPDFYGSGNAGELICSSLLASLL